MSVSSYSAGRGGGTLWQPVLSKHIVGTMKPLEILIFGLHDEGNEMHPSQTREHSLRGKYCFLCIQLSVTGASRFCLFSLKKICVCVFKYCQLLYSAAVCIALVVNTTRWEVGGDRWNYRTST